MPERHTRLESCKAILLNLTDGPRRIFISPTLTSTILWLWRLLYGDIVIIPLCLEAEMHVKLSKEFV